MHFHVLATNSAFVIYREHSFPDHHDAIDFFLALSREFYGGKIKGDPLDIEQYLYDTIETKDYDPVTIGAPTFIISFVPCGGCKNRKLYN